MTWNAEVASGKRFRFGANWARFVRSVNTEQIAEAEDALRTMLGASSLNGLSLLDVGAGSGLSSLASRNLGAEVHSFDYDPEAVAAINALKRRFRPEDTAWSIDRGSILDDGYVRTLGRYDVVYSWGVLHHTGAMWRAIENAASLVRPGGIFAIAVYNDQGRRSRRALAMKRRYVQSGRAGRALELGKFVLAYSVKQFLVDLRDRQNPLAHYRRGERGMALWTDIVDWVGGYPFEVATPDAMLAFMTQRGFRLEWMRTVAGGWGNNEFRFRSSSR